MRIAQTATSFTSTVPISDDLLRALSNQEPMLARVVAHELRVGDQIFGQTLVFYRNLMAQIVVELFDKRIKWLSEEQAKGVMEGKKWVKQKVSCAACLLCCCACCGAVVFAVRCCSCAVRKACMPQ